MAFFVHRGKRLKTRLISIVSKPILIVVVVVVIDVVFVKKMLGSNKCWFKITHIQKTLGKKILGQKESGPK